MRTKLIATIAAAALAAGLAGFVASRGDAGLVAGFLRVTPSALSFVGESERSVTLANAGPRAVSYDIATDADWLAAEPSAGLVARGASVTVTVRSDPGDSPAGEVRGSLTVRTADGDASIPAVLVIDRTTTATGAARLEVPASIDLPATATETDLRIANDGAEQLRWTATTADPFLTLDSEGGTIGGGETTVARVAVDRSRLQEGRIVSAIRIASNGGEAQIGVTIAVERIPLLEMTTTALAFPTIKGGRETLPLEVRNAGLAPLTYQGSIDKSYVRLANAAGTVAPGEAARIQVTYEYDEAGEGARRGELRVTSDGGDGVVLVTATRDSEGPYANPRAMSEVHRHCEGGDCALFRHVTSTITDLSEIVEVKVQYQVCAGVPKSEVTCDGFRFLPMRRAAGNQWFADVGPLSACIPGKASYIPWRIWATDSLGNLKMAPGSAVSEIRPHCNSAGELR